MWVRHGVETIQRTLRNSVESRTVTDLLFLRTEIHTEGCGSAIQGWFDDRVESRNALSKLPLLNATPLDRKDLPWSCDPESDREERVDILMDTDVRQFKSGT